jgi:hypothetical protein
MSIQAPQGILNIPNATLRVGKLAVDEVVGADTILNTVARNTILLVDDEAYHENKNWGLKLPNAWAGEFECNTASAGNYSEFNFYNEGASSNAQGYNLTFNDTDVQLRYDGTLLKTGTLASTITGTGVKKVRLMFERTILSVTVDGTLVFTHDDTVGPRPRVYSTTAGGFLNFFTDGGALKNLKIVNEKWMSDGTSNIAYVGGGEVAVGQALAFNRVSNVSQIKVDANVVTEYTGPHDRPLRKYPEVAMTSATTGGYTVTHSGTPYPGGYEGWRAFDEVSTTEWISDQTAKYSTSTPFDANSPSTDGLSGISGVSGTRAGSWVKLELPKKIRLQKTEIFRRDVSDQRFDQAYVYGSNDDTNWYQLSSITNPTYGQPASASGDMGPSIISHSTDSTTFYKYFVIQITSLVDNVGTANIGQAYFYGHEEGSGSLDTTLKSVYNVPATTGTQLEVYYDGQDYTGVTSTVTDKAGTATNATIANTDSAITFDSTYKAWTFGGTDTRTSNIQSSALASTFSGDQVHSVALWFKCDIVSGDTLFSITQPSDPWEDPKKVISVRFSDESGGLRYLFWSNDIQYDGTEAKITKDIWYHLCVTYSGGGGTTENKKLYLNGNELHHTSTGGDYPGADLELPSGSVIRLGSRVQETTRFFGSIANFRLYSKALNADQVKELYDYQKDYFLGSKSQVTLYKGHLGVGVTEPSGQLELAGDERIQEYPPRAMTGYETLVEGHGVFCAYASTDYDDPGPYRSWNAFDKSISTVGGNNGWASVVNSWLNDGTTTPISSLAANFDGIECHWLALQLPYEVKPTLVTLQARNGSQTPPEAPTKGRIYGSKDGVTWNQIRSYNIRTEVGTLQANTDNAPISISLTTNEYYTHLLLTVDERYGGSGTATWTSIGELRYFGTPGPTTLDKGSLTLGRSLDVPRISRYDVDTETPRYEKLVVDFDTTVNSSPTDISGKGNHGTFYGGAYYSAAEKAFFFDGTDDYIDIPSVSGVGTGAWVHSKSFWFKLHSSTDPGILFLLGRNGSTRQIAVQVNGSGQFQYFIYGCNSRVQVNGSDWFPDVNRWYHCVTVFRNNETTADGSVLTGREMYIDGVKQTLVAIGNQIALDLDSSEVRFGNQFNSNYLDYELSNPKLYSVALEPSEVKKLYNLGRTGRSMVISDTAVGIGKVPEAQLDVRGTIGIDNILWSGGNWTHPLLPEAEFYWNPQSYISKPFSNATTAGSTITDMNGKMNGIQGNVGWYNNWWEINSTASYIETVSNMDLRRNWTIIIWNKSSGGDRRLAGHGQPTDNDGFHLTSYGATKIRFGFHGNDVDSSEDYFTDSNTWCQFAATYYHATGATQNRQVFQNERKITDMRQGLLTIGNGSGVQTVAYAGTPTPLRFGTNYGTGNNSSLNNKYGPIAFFGRVLTAGEIRSLYNYFRITWQPGGE